MLVLIAHNIRSTHNVGSLLRTAEGLGVETVYMTGYTPYPKLSTDRRLPHISEKLHKQIRKTALGAETTQAWRQTDDIMPLLQSLRADGYVIAALEQHQGSIPLPNYDAPEKVAIIVGHEVEGIETEVLAAADVILQIPMDGQKESFNVAQAAAMALYHMTFFGKSKT